MRSLSSHAPLFTRGPLAIAFLALVAGPLGGCGVDDTHHGQICLCPNGAPPEQVCLDEGGVPDTNCPDAGTPPPEDAGADGADTDASSALCGHGTCMPPAPQAWQGPVLAWSGPEIARPACPERAPDPVWQGWAMPAPGPIDCPACSCDPPEGTCEIPATWNVYAAVCQDLPAPPSASFAAPDGWGGTCTTANALPAGSLCGGALCVQSLTVAAPLIKEEPCTPHEEAQPKPPGLWPSPFAVAALACGGDFSACVESSETCVPNEPGFRACIYQEGEADCPAGWNEARDVFYKKVVDTQECAPCTCSAPEGGACFAKVHVYEDATCSNEHAAITISAATSGTCVNLIPGAGLGSKSAELLSYTPGTCTPIGGVTGEVKAEQPVTFCCSGAASS
jgi:hypothetical protein